MKRSLSQQLQRLRQNAIGAQKRKDKVAQGLCGCGSEREDVRWKLCERCREQARNRYYGIANAASPRPPKRPKQEWIAPKVTGVRRVVEADGLGNVNAWWTASCYFDHKQVSRRWSIRKHGERVAFKHACEQRKSWKELKESLEGG